MSLSACVSVCVSACVCLGYIIRFLYHCRFCCAEKCISMVSCAFTQCIYSVRTVPSSGRVSKKCFVGELYRHTSGKICFWHYTRLAMCKSACPKNIPATIHSNISKLNQHMWFLGIAKKMTVHLKMASRRVRNVQGYSLSLSISI